ncbi:MULTISPECIES: YheC/YheD family protein [Allobacillus]|uniref:DUF8042 domain-containing protein n=1 Tax=Allobacillus salarius TaxID=1955272 RepID=A0A556PQW9_9BACI|nr:YheC/YheD family protein [Allobacillus salarius]TSJ66793.1 hypothetical protein FPQ13_03615 [Allobacillus salarius]
MKLKQKEQKQVTNITQTVVEAGSHLIQLLRDKNLKDSAYIFSSMIEGYSVVRQVTDNDAVLNSKLENIDSQLYRQMESLSGLLEQGNLMKATEIVQFSFNPTLKKWQNGIQTYYQIEEKTSFTIGVYFHAASPLKAYSEPRVNALVEAAAEQGSTIFFFSSQDVDLENKKIEADIFRDGSWTRDSFDYPDVIHNGFSQNIFNQSRVERKLRREIPFTSFVFGDKLQLPKRIVENRKYAELLIPFTIIQDEQKVIDYIERYQKVVLKPIRGARGENIYFAEKNGEKYRVSQDTNTAILNKEDFIQWLYDTILSKDRDYIVQKYLHVRTKKGEPFDFRIHMQKNGEGKWQITKMYPRTGYKNSNQIKIYQGGPLKDLNSFLEQEFGKDAIAIKEKLMDLALNLTFHIDKLYGLALDEMGLDIAIDENQRMWLFEANMGPQTKAHEKERADNVIAYSRFLAKHRIFHTNQMNERSLLKGFFDAEHSKLPYAENQQQKKIGLLNDKKQLKELRQSLAEEIEGTNSFYFFSPSDIDIDEMQIRGAFYNDGEWEEKITDYPDVLIDCFKTKDNNFLQSIYEEFESIPFINETIDQLREQTQLLTALGNNEEMNNYLPPYQKVTHKKEVIRFLDTEHAITLKKNISNQNEDDYIIHKTGKFDYVVISDEGETNYNQITLTHFIEDRLKENQWFVQKHAEGNDVEIEMIRTNQHEWTTIGDETTVQPVFQSLQETLVSIFGNKISNAQVTLTVTDGKPIITDMTINNLEHLESNQTVVQAIAELASNL